MPALLFTQDRSFLLSSFILLSIARYSCFLTGYLQRPSFSNLCPGTSAFAHSVNFAPDSSAEETKAYLITFTTLCRSRSIKKSIDIPSKIRWCFYTSILIERSYSPAASVVETLEELSLEQEGSALNSQYTSI